MASGIDRIVKLAMGDASRHRWLLAGAFVATLAIASVIGFGWPKVYTSYATVMVEDEGILGTLMQGTAVQGGVADRARVAQEVIHGHRILSQVVGSDPWPPAESDGHLQRMMAGVRGDTMITNVGESLIRIEYSDANPERAYQGAQRMAEYFVRESLDAKAGDSRSALAFIDRQTREYGQKTAIAKRELEAFRQANEDLHGTTPEGARQQVTLAVQELETMRRTLREAEVRKASLEEQLRGESSTLSAEERVDAVSIRLAELERELSELRRRYHDAHPDVSRVAAEMADLRARANSGDVGGTGATVSALNPIHQQIRQDLYRTSADIAAMRASVRSVEERLSDARSRVTRLETVEEQLSHLTRSYEVNHDLYQDLLRRREQARLSLDLTEGGHPLRVAEPAFLPHSATGPELLHFVLGGTLLGLILPFAGLIGWQQASPKVRDRSDLTEGLELPVIAAVPHYATPREQAARLRGTLMLVVVVGTAVIAAIALVVMRMQGVI